MLQQIGPPLILRVVGQVTLLQVTQRLSDKEGVALGGLVERSGQLIADSGVLAGHLMDVPLDIGLPQAWHRQPDLGLGAPQGVQKGVQLLIFGQVIGAIGQQHKERPLREARRQPTENGQRITIGPL